jgi:hypothetical protein
MKRHLPAWSLALAAAVVLAAAEPALAQRAVPRGRTDNDRGSQGDSGGGRTAVPRGGSDGGSAPAAPRTGGATARPAGSDSGDSQRTPPPYTRPRGDQNQTGSAVRRPANNPPPFDDDVDIIVPGYGYGYYPWGWGYGGYGIGGYYGFYDPWWYGPYYYQPRYYSGGYEGSLRLKIKPREAEVFVDGYFAGKVDEFDGIFQQLPIESGPHRIEVRAEGYEPLTFEVRILPNRKVTYEGELKRVP